MGSLPPEGSNPSSSAVDKPFHLWYGSVMKTKTKPALHVKAGDRIVFTSQITGAQVIDTVQRVNDDGYGNITMSFPATFTKTVTGEKLETNPESYVVMDAKVQVEYEV